MLQAMPFTGYSSRADGLKTLALLCSMIVLHGFSFSQTFPNPVLWHLRDDSTRNELFLYPAALWSNTNGLMPLIHITNQLTDTKKIRVKATPVWSGKHHEMMGNASFAWQQTNHKKSFAVKDIYAQTMSFFIPLYGTEKYRYYQWQTGIHFSTHRDSSQFNHELHLSVTQNGTEFPEFEWNGMYTLTKAFKVLQAAEISYHGYKNARYRPQSVILQAGLFKEALRFTSRYELDLHYAPQRSFVLRLMGSAYAFSSNRFRERFDGRLNASATSFQQDILYDGCFIGRNSSYSFHRQEGMAETGPLYSVSPLIKTWKWFLASSASVSLPLGIPVRFYLAAAMLPDPFDNNVLMGVFEGGILLMPVKKYFEIAFPLFYDARTHDVLQLNTENYLQQIRLIINFEQLKTLKWPQKKS